MKNMISLPVTFLSVIYFNGLLATDSLTYRAGVVEYHPVNGSAEDVVKNNLEEYLKLISEAGIEDVDILVFPEATLNRHWNISKPQLSAVKVPLPKDKEIPCQNDEYSQIMQQISCAAKAENMYIVINVAEATNCNETIKENCTDGEILLFNTNVVFDRNGTVISRYRKINLWGETGFTGSLEESLGTFDTDFGVTFGHFICFDILFQSPAVATVEKAKIQNIIFPTMWFSELPSLTAVEIQEAWAYTHNVNFLAAGANNPWVGSSGSGIYSGKAGALKSIMSGKAKTVILIDNVPKTPGNIVPEITNEEKNEEMDLLYLKKHNLTLYDTVLIDQSKNFQEHTLSYGNSTCQFKINITKIDSTSTKYYFYRAIIYDGMRSFEFKNAGIIECGILACTSADISTCADRFSNYSDFAPSFEITKMEILATVPKPKFNDTMQTLDTAYYPVTLLTSIMPLKFTDYQYKLSSEDNSNMVRIEMVVNKPQRELLMFGIFGRTFHKDHLPLTDDSSALYASYRNVFVSVSTTLYFLYNKVM